MSTSITDTYKTIAAPAEGLFRDRGSKFLAYAFPARTEEEALARLDEVCKAHPKARHHCFAWRLGYDGTRFRANDDGEPSGTAGRPILGQIDSFGLTDVVVIVVRYFGGTLLGTSGLIRAYREATADALAKAQIVERVRAQHVRLSFDYSLMGPVMSALERLGLQPLTQQFDETATIEVAVRLSQRDAILLRLKALVADVPLEQAREMGEVSGLKVEILEEG